MAGVLLDGSPAALRALELAAVPGFLIQHESNQLVLFHGLSETKDVSQLQAIPAALDLIAKSRVAQNTLNYKIETCKVQSEVVNGASAAATPTPGGPTPAPGDKPAKGAKKQADAKAPAPVDPPAAPAAKPEKTPEEVAKIVADFVQGRASHHHTQHLLLGVGASMQGKSIAVGSVAKEMLARFRGVDVASRPSLFFMKGTGPIVRPTAALRFIALVVPSSDGDSLEHVRRLLRLASVQGRGDRVGVMVVANNGMPKPPQQTVVSLAEDEDESEEAAHLRLVQQTMKDCAALLNEHGLSDASTGSPHDDSASLAAQETFPLLNQIVLEPTNQLPTPMLDEVPAQFTKAVGAFKCDFVALPPPSADSTVVSDGFAHACLSAPKPHVLLL